MTGPRYATLAEDAWTLRDAEEVNRQHPESFEIPPSISRHNLVRGTLAKVMFEIQAPDEEGNPDTGVERMWVIVTERIDDRYLGLLDNQPYSLDPDNEDVYLRLGAEICFGPEHVIDINAENVAESTIAESLVRAPSSRWPR